MKPSIRIILLLSAICLYTSSCQNKIDRRIENIETFAKLYGYARWFHPSDESQEIDWDKFAVLGIQKVENTKSESELRDSLYQLFSPIVQGLQIHKTGKHNKFNSDILLSPDSNAKPIAWQHYGVYLNKQSNIYKSERTNRIEPNIQSDAAIFCKLITNPTHLHGKEVKLSAYLKNMIQDKEGAKLFIQYIKQDDNKIYDTVIDSEDFKEYELKITVPNNTSVLAYGLWMVDDSDVVADDFDFSVNSNGEWKSLDTTNMGFESGMIDEGNQNDWKALNMTHCTFDVIDTDVRSGNYSLKCTFNYSGKIFNQVPQFGETINEPIGSNLTCVVPIVLLTNDSSTYPITEPSIIKQLNKEINDIKYGTEFNHQVSLAGVVTTWNIIQHFFPYFDVIDINWDNVLSETLESTLLNKNKKDFFVTISKMLAKIDDGHGIVFGEQMHHLPIKAEYIEGQVVITASSNSKLKNGDIIKTIDGKPVMDVLAEKEEMISGSPQLKRHRALNILGSKFSSENSELVIESNGEKINVTTQTSINGNMYFNPIYNSPYMSETIVEIEPGIYYVNMSKCTENIFDNRINELATAKAVIYDQRNRAELSFFHIIPHLVEEAVSSTYWNIPQTIYPNRKEVEFYKTNWYIQPKLPLIKSKSIIINEPSVVSAGETVMGIIDNYNLATTVGEATAGCNGNINTIKLPYGYSAWFTGMKVLKHDGSQLYINGFVPDYPVSKTIQAIKEGRDEYIEKALEIARNK